VGKSSLGVIIDAGGATPWTETHSVKEGGIDLPAVKYGSGGPQRGCACPWAGCNKTAVSAVVGVYTVITVGATNGLVVVVAISGSTDMHRAVGDDTRTDAEDMRWRLWSGMMDGVVNASIEIAMNTRNDPRNTVMRYQCLVVEGTTERIILL
jgi:hypothetical protein